MQRPNFSELDEFPFRRLARLLAPIEPPADLAPIDLSLGEPKHSPPDLLAATVAENGHLWNRYPPVTGTAEFRAAVKSWLDRRYDLAADFLLADKNILPLTGTKEGLFLLPSAVAGMQSVQGRSLVLLPDPVYSVYVGAAVLAGLEPRPLPATRETGFLPDLSALTPEQLDQTLILMICSPANPQGAIASHDYLAQALALARRHGFLLVLDECYSEIYLHGPPAGGLQVAQDLGRDCDRLVVMHSLSKRSNAAGLRSGFIAGDAKIIADFARFRAYGSAVQPLPLMAAATALWQDETHVEENRAAYQTKLHAAKRMLGNHFRFAEPAGGFFLWIEVDDGIAAAELLWREAGLKVVPGAYLTASPDPNGDVGGRYIRIALVHDEATVIAGLERLLALSGRLLAERVD